MPGRKDSKLDSGRLFQAGFIIPRAENFYQYVQLFSLPSTDHGVLLKRIEALTPSGIAIERYLYGDNQAIYCTSSWKAKLVRGQEQHASSGEDWQAYEFWFTNPKRKADYQAILQMNVLATAIEKAFLLASPQTVVRMQYGSTTARDFEVGPEAAKGSSIFEIAELAEFSPFSLALKAVKIGSEAAIDVFDSVQAKAINKALVEANATDGLLLSRYLGMPALPDMLKALVDSGSAAPGSVASGSAAPEPAAPGSVASGTAAPDTVFEAGSSADTMEPDSGTVRRCPSCGAEAEVSDLFCGACGTSLKDA